MSIATSCAVSGVCDGQLDETVELATDSIRKRCFLPAYKTLCTVLKQHPEHERAQHLLEEILYGRDYPDRVIIEPTNFCKMGCPVCSGRGGEVGFMPREKFEVLLEELGPRLQEVWLHQRGDPFYHREIYDFIDIVGRYEHLKCVMHTHGSHVLDCERLVSSPAKLELFFSLDGADQESLQYYRRNADFDQILENMKRILALKRELGRDYPRVNWKYIVMRPNERMMDQAKRIAEEIGVDHFAFSEFGINWTTLSRSDFKSLMKEFVPTDRKFFHEDYDAAMGGVIARRTPQSPHCFHVNVVKATVRWNGDLIPCCMCLRPHEHVMGNVFESGFGPIWRSSPYREFRKQSVIDPTRQIPCDRCAIVF
jgi:radical SAM protein with 4Fe4S-binding SPASM domain